MRLPTDRELVGIFVVVVPLLLLAGAAAVWAMIVLGGMR